MYMKHFILLKKVESNGDDSVLLRQPSPLTNQRKPISNQIWCHFNKPAGKRKKKKTAWELFLPSTTSLTPFVS